ncbi:MULTISPECIES: hypothetical protein [unclassified Mycobacterium]|uniref:hypothetical protein n=1 Tax=unclassified Mycobacterium TaxID=2642494 RepID=UPI001E61D4D0|nr:MULTISPECIES: hypothetical protein [unclassified Mycobacterium]
MSINRREALNSVTEDVHHVFATNWKALDADDDAVPDEALALGERFAALPPRTLRSSKVALNMHLARLHKMYWSTRSRRN